MVSQSNSKLGYDGQKRSIAKVNGYQDENSQLRRRNEAHHEMGRQRKTHNTHITLEFQRLARDQTVDGAKYVEFNGHKIIAIKLGPLAMVVRGTNFIYVSNKTGKRTAGQGGSAQSQANRALRHLQCYPPIGQKMCRGDWPEKIKRHGWVYYINKEFHATGDVSRIRCSNKCAGPGVKYDDLIAARLV